MVPGYINWGWRWSVIEGLDIDTVRLPDKMLESVGKIKMLSIIVLEVSVILVGRVIDGSIWWKPRILRKLAWEALESQVERSILKSPIRVKD